MIDDDGDDAPTRILREHEEPVCRSFPHGMSCPQPNQALHEARRYGTADQQA